MKACAWICHASSRSLRGNVGILPFLKFFRVVANYRIRQRVESSHGRRSTVVPVPRRTNLLAMICQEEAAAAGIPTVIASGLHGGILGKIFEEKDVVGTLILAEATRLTSRKHWIAYNLKPAGEIVVDQGAHDAVVQKGKSLLPSGLKEVRGAFGVGECVRCLNSDGREFARGLVNYSAQELNQIKGLHTSRIEKMLGYKAYEEIIHRDDLVVL